MKLEDTLRFQELGRTEQCFLDGYPTHQNPKPAYPLAHEDVPLDMAKVELFIPNNHRRIDQMRACWSSFVDVEMRVYAHLSDPWGPIVIYPDQTEWSNLAGRRAGMSGRKYPARRDDYIAVFSDSDFPPLGDCTSFIWTPDADFGLVWLLDAWQQDAYWYGATTMPPAEWNLDWIYAWHFGYWLVTDTDGVQRFPFEFHNFLHCWNQGPGRIQDYWGCTPKTWPSPLPPSPATHEAIA